MADNFSALRTSREEPSLFERVHTAAQLTPEARYEMTSGASDTQFEKGLRSAAAGLTAGSFANEALSQEVGGDAGWQRSRDLALQTQAQGHMYAPRVSSLRDIGSLEDAGDFAAGAIGQGAMSMAPTLATALLTRGRGRFGTATGFAGGATTAYGLERGEAALNQYADPTLAAASAEDRDLAATTKGVINAGLEAIVPAGLAGSVLRKPAGSFLGHVGRDALTEGLTEAAQQGVGFGAEKYLDPNRQLDPWDVADAFATGALTGGGVSAATRGPAYGAQALVDRFARGQQEDAAPIDLNPPSDPMEGAPPDTPLLPAPDDGSGGGVGDLFDTLNERFGPGIREQAQRTKDYVSDTIDRMTEAAKTAQSPDEFLRQVFGNSSEEAAADLRPDTEDPIVLNAADPAAALRQRDAERQQRAARFAEELLNDPATPDAVKERVASFGGDFSNPEAQAFVARNLVAQRAGEKLATAVMDLIALSKDFGTDMATKARDMLDEGMTAAADRIVKKNLQDVPPAEQAAFNKLIFDNLTDEAKANPTVRQHLPEIANAMLAFAARTGELTKADLKTLSRMQDGLAMFRDPEALAAQLTEYAGLPRTEGSFLSRIKRVTNAQQDVRQPNSFLYSSLTEEAKDTLSPAQLKQLARLVDDFTIIDADKEQGDKVLAGLTAAFGSKESAQAVLDYYRRQNRADLRFDPNETLTEDDTTEDDTLYYGEEFGSLTEQDAAEMTASYRDPNPARPFFRSTDRAALRDARRAAPPGSRVATLREYVAQTDESPQVVAARIRQDLRKRLTAAENRDTATVQEAIASMEAVPEAARNEDFNQLLSQLKNRKTENRTDLPGLRKQLEVIEKASGVSFKEVDDLRKRIRRAELADNAGIDNDDIANLPALRKQLSKLEDRYAKNAEKVLERYAVVMRPKDETFANDELVAKFRGILDKLPNANIGTPAERAKKREAIAKIKKTAIKFNRKGGKTPITLSAESMAYASQARGSMKERFFDSLAAVLARPDIEGLVPPAPDTLISRQTGLTWGDIAPEKPVDNRTERQKKAQREKDATAAWAKQERMRADIETWPKLMAALRDVQRRFLADRLGLTLAPDETLSLTDLINRFPPAQRPEMRANANEAGFQAALGWAKTLSRKLATTPKRNYTDESRMRVLEKYIDEQLSDRFPMPEGDERASRRLAEERQASGMYEDEDSIGGAILDAEAELDMLEERLDAVQGITGLKRKYVRLVREAQLELDRLADSVRSPEQRDARVPGVREAPREATFRAPEAINALYDIAVKGNYGRLDTPEKVLRYATMAREMMDQLAQIPGGVRSDRQQELLSKLRADFKQDGNAAFDWDKLFDGMKPTDEQRALLKDIVTNKKSIDQRVVLPKTSPYTAKDQAKSDRANKFIGRGAPGSSTAAYAEAWGDRANTGVYDSDDVVFISVNGNRPGALSPPWAEIKKAMSAGATLITDTPADRARKFNTGERAVAEFLGKNGYRESSPGTWVRDSVVRKKSFVGAKADPAASSKMGGRPGRPGKDWGDKEAVKAEILRLRGKDVKVAVEKLVKQLRGSGQYTYNPKTGERLIEVAINARSPLGTARHEAMHDLFRFLSENEATRSIARDLRDATSAPHVIRRLRELLKDHKAALGQLSDPEERAAYAYQFWAEGLLQIGPTGTGIFNTIRQFIRDLFGIVTASQRGEDLMRAFHDGKFADPSTVQEVLQDINDRSGDRLSNKMNRAAPALTRALNAMFSAAPNRLRRFENDYLSQLADKFQPESGMGFVQNKFQQEGVWTNRLAGILRGTTAVERREAIDQLQSMKPTSKLAKELLKFNEDIYEYMRDAGVQSWDSDTKKFVPLRKVQGYFTRSWDPDAIARNRTEFEALLRTEGGVSAANAAALTENLVRGSEQRPKPKESPVDLGFMPYAPHTSERVLTFIKPSNADKFAKFQRKDLADIMTSYIRGATHRAEYAREFGNNGEKIVDLVAKSSIRGPEELKEISNAVQALEGSLDPGNWSVQTKEAMSALMTLQNVTLLPLALMSQMIDPIVLAARTGDLKDAGTAYVTALKRLKNTITKSNNKVPGEELAEILGVVSEDSTLQAMSMAYGATRMSKRMENINRVFFKYNGMQGWNNSMRIAATAAGEKYLLAHKNDARALAELGLEPKDIKSVDGKLDVSNPKVQQAMFQFVDQAVLRPSAANRPVWMSDPRFLLVAHLKQFTFAMHNVVLKRANRELQNDNPKPWGVLMLAMPVILAADMAKFALTGTTPSTWGFKDYLVHAVERAGLLGLGDFGVQATRGVDMGKMPGEGLLGPTFENLMEILRWIGGDPRTSLGDVIDRTVPGSRFI